MGDGNESDPTNALADSQPNVGRCFGHRLYLKYISRIGYWKQLKSYLACSRHSDSNSSVIHVVPAE